MRVILLILVFMSVTRIVAYGEEPQVQIFKLKSEEINIPSALLTKLLKESVEDCIEFSNPKKALSAYSIDLNQDGKPEIVVIANCNSTNCPIWFFSKCGHQFIPLLKDRGNDYKVLRPTNYGYHDLLIIGLSTPSMHVGTVYRFNGKKYKEIKSFSEKNEPW